MEIVLSVRFLPILTRLSHQEKGQRLIGCGRDFCSLCKIVSVIVIHRDLLFPTLMGWLIYIITGNHVLSLGLAWCCGVEWIINLFITWPGWLKGESDLNPCSPKTLSDRTAKERLVGMILWSIDYWHLCFPFLFKHERNNLWDKSLALSSSYTIIINQLF